jgi:Rrf2 family protein
MEKTMTAEYMVAVHAIVYLNHKKTSLSSEELAENVCTNPARIRKVMAKLEKAGLVEGRHGAGGGYNFTRDPQKTSLLEILDALKETLVEVKWRSGSMDMDCRVASGMADVMDDVLGTINKDGKERLAHITIGDIDSKLFSGGNSNEKI